MKFLLVLEQPGGCDYTIGCGTAIKIIEAKSEAEVMENIFPYLAKNYGDPSDGYIDEAIEEATLYRVAGTIKVDLEKYRMEYQRQIAKETRQKTEARERAELERLKRKYRS